MSTRTVGHFRTEYLQLTETFIYNYLNGHEQYDPFICSIKSSNLDEFPFSPKYILEEIPKNDPRRWYYELLRCLQFDKRYYRSVLTAERPDIIHAHFGPMGVKLAGQHPEDAPLVTSFYGYDLSQVVTSGGSVKDRLRSRYYRRRYSELFKRGDLFLVEGPAMKEKLIEAGCPEHKAGIQHIGINVEEIEPNYPNGGVDSVLMVGRFVEKKGMPDGIRAFGRTFSGTDTTLRIVGGEASHGYSESDLREVAKGADVGNQVKFTGYLDHQEYLREVQNCDVLLVPSKTASDGDSEGGAPTVILEAQAKGKPVIGTRHADIPYYVSDGVSGGLADPGDISGISKELQRLIEDPGLLREYGYQGRQYVLQHHDIHDLIVELEEKYDALLTEHN